MEHAVFMKQALELAGKGWPAVQPNPMVGCVIVRDNKVVAEGYHEYFGGPHAEVNALNALPSGIEAGDCTLYITLEPCRHHGKTPPCADLIIERGVKKVVVACTDPNPLMSGAGVRKLLEAGIEVITNVLEQEARHQNRRFTTFYEKKRPYVFLKWALSGDGFISRDPVPAKREDNVITGPESLREVHRMRSECMAVLVGKNTVVYDNPRLTTRLVKGDNPLRAFIDRNLEVPRTAAVFSDEAPTMVFNSKKEGSEDHCTYLKIDFEGNIPEQVLHWFYQHNIHSLLVEGGRKLLNDFIAKRLYDEAFVFQNPDLRFGQGLKGPEFPFPNTFELVGEDKLYHTVNREVPVHRLV